MCYKKLSQIILVFLSTLNLEGKELNKCTSFFKTKNLASIVRLAKIPQYYEVSKLSINNKPSQRLMIVCRSNGCAYKNLTNNLPIGKQVCRHCNFNKESISKNDYIVQPKDHLHQLISIVELHKRQIESGAIEQIDILSSGNVLNSKSEFSKSFWIDSGAYISKFKKIKKVILEGRSEYVTKENLSLIRSSFREDILIEISIGVESTNPKVWKFLKKGFSVKSFQKAIEVIRSTKNMGLHVNLLLKPLPEQTEPEYIQDALKSAMDVLELSKGLSTRIALHPMFISPETYIEKLYLEGRYTLPSIESVAKTVYQIKTLASSLGHDHLASIFAGLSDESLSFGRKVVKLETLEQTEAIRKFNESQEVRDLNLN